MRLQVVQLSRPRLVWVPSCVCNWLQVSLAALFPRKDWLLAEMPQFFSMCSPVLHQTSSGFFTGQFLESKKENRRSHSSERTQIYFQNSLSAKASHKSSPDLRNGEIDSTSQWEVLQSHIAKGCWWRVGKLWPSLESLTCVIKKIKGSNGITKWQGKKLLCIRSEKTSLQRQNLRWHVSDKKQQQCFTD